MLKSGRGGDQADGRFEIFRKGTWQPPSAKEIARADALLEAIEAAEVRLAQKIKREEDYATRGQVATLAIADLKLTIAARKAEIAPILAAMDAPNPPVDAMARYETANRALITAAQQLEWQRREKQQASALFDEEAERDVDVVHDLEAARTALAEAGFRLAREGVQSAARLARQAALDVEVAAARAKRGLDRPAAAVATASAASSSTAVATASAASSSTAVATSSAASSSSSTAAPAAAVASTSTAGAPPNRRRTMTRTKGGLLDVPKVSNNNNNNNNNKNNNNNNNNNKNNNNNNNNNDDDDVV